MKYGKSTTVYLHHCCRLWEGFSLLHKQRSNHMLLASMCEFLNFFPVFKNLVKKYDENFVTKKNNLKVEKFYTTEFFSRENRYKSATSKALNPSLKFFLEKIIKFLGCVDITILIWVLFSPSSS